MVPAGRFGGVSDDLWSGLAHISGPTMGSLASRPVDLKYDAMELQGETLGQLDGGRLGLSIAGIRWQAQLPAEEAAGMDAVPPTFGRGVDRDPRGHLYPRWRSLAPAHAAMKPDGHQPRPRRSRSGGSGAVSLHRNGPDAGRSVPLARCTMPPEREGVPCLGMDHACRRVRIHPPGGLHPERLACGSARVPVPKRLGNPRPGRRGRGG